MFAVPVFTLSLLDDPLATGDPVERGDPQLGPAPTRCLHHRPGPGRLSFRDSASVLEGRQQEPGIDRLLRFPEGEATGGGAEDVLDAITNRARQMIRIEAIHDRNGYRRRCV